MVGWKTKTLGEVLLKTETINPALLPDKEFDYIDVSSVSNETYVVEATKRLKGRDAPSRARRHVRPGDVLLATIRPTLKRIAVVPPELDGQVCSTGYFVLRPCSEIDHRFLFYSLFTEQFMGAMESLQKGASYPAVTDAEVRAQPLSYPTLLEQRRIVAILDEAFEVIATVKANGERNLQNARELFESVMQLLFSGHGPSWTERTLEDVCEISSKLVDPREPAYLDLPHIGAGNVESKSGAVVDVKTAREEQLISGKFLFHENSVLYSKIRPYLMKVVRPAFSGLCSADIYPLVPKSGRIDRDYLYYLLLTPSFTEYAIKGSARAGMPKVNRAHLFAYRSWMPSIQEQARLAARLDALVDETQRLAEVSDAKLAALDELKKSLLHQAFTGALTAISTDEKLEAVA